MTYLAEHGVLARKPPRALRQARTAATRQVRCRDTRWPAVAAALASLRNRRRCSVRIVDAECGSGTLLLCAVRLARTLGFTAIEARGIDDAAAPVKRAGAAASALHDPAIAITFETDDPCAALSAEADFPADIVLWHGYRARRGPNARRELGRAVVRAGDMTIADAPDRADADA